MEEIFKNNRKWVEGKLAEDKDYFHKLAATQKPDYLFIGCSDSRVHSNEITGAVPGQMFVHRNIANLVVHTDINLLSVLQYAVEVLKVKHVIVCGHYGCGGVLAAMGDKQFGLIDNWLANIKDVLHANREKIAAVEDEEKRAHLCVELNVIDQVQNLYKTSVIQNALRGENPPQLHGWVYDLREGLLKDLDWRTGGFDKLAQQYGMTPAVADKDGKTPSASSSAPVVETVSA
jgi:carbonic anhydrase